ncbi:Alpha/Beta hydrolase protein [Roridomyces roridus]|uniref:Alpha/Beta hydrolase protein n=1 Tax=Roridomyces roridus TaxID=1738132 RepID=A0AAD7FNE9_9AGAR|nr:Alpha/Beta hydrolase protein [Roridomyces roridus]
MSFCDDCFKGVTHEGTPAGKVEHIGGIECYVAKPAQDHPKDKVVLFLTDVFGIVLENNLLLADDFARNGLRTIVPDLFNGDPVPKGGFDGSVPPVSREVWHGKHGAAQIRPILDSVIATLKAEGVTRFAATGYCFGARYVVDLALDNAIQVSALSHPSRLVVPDDLEKYFAVSTAPLLLNTCTIDPVFPHEAQAKADEIFGEGKFEPGYRREYFDGCKHGFAVRGDMSDPIVKAGKEGAFKASVEWFLKYL